jgi:hypothetical protein
MKEKFMRNDLLAPARRARRNPLKKRNIERVERDLKSLVADPQHVQNRDREFSGFVSRQFSRVYGDGPIERDATGWPARGTPLRADIEVFHPSPGEATSPSTAASAPARPTSRPT